MSNEHFIKSANLKEEEGISPIDRWILACLVKGLQGKSDISKISLTKISSYCKYVDNNGKLYSFGEKAVQSSIDRLQEAGKIEILKPEKKGMCTRYKVNEIKHFEKLSEEFFNLNLPPIAKGYLLCALQSNLNRDEETFEPNSTQTKTTFNIAELSKKYNMPISSIYKAEKILKNCGIMTITQDKDNRKDQTTGLVLQNRSIDLEKIGLGEFVIGKLAEHEQRLNNTYTKEEIDAMFAQLRPMKTAPQDAKEAEYWKDPSDNNYNF